MKFETIKSKAITAYCTAIQEWSGGLASDVLTTTSAFKTLLPFVLATKSDRDEMRAFADAYELTERTDWIAAHAKSKTGQKLDVVWAQVILRAREAGVDLISSWDVRCVNRLVELFPESVPKSHRGQSLLCFQADNESADWMVEIAPGPQDNEGATQTMQMS